MYTRWSSFFQNPTFLLLKIPREGNWVPNKIPTCNNSALWYLRSTYSRLFIFLKNLKTPKRLIEINWLLVQLTRFWIKFLVMNIDFSFDSSTVSASNFIESSCGLQIQKCSIRGQTMNPVWWILLVFDLKSIQQCWGHQTLKFKKINFSKFPSRLCFSAKFWISLQ